MKLAKKKKYLLKAMLCLAFLMTGCSSLKQAVSGKMQWQDTDFAMGTVISQNMYGKDGKEIAKKVLNTIKDLEKTISWRMDGSDIAKINQAAGKKEGIQTGEKTAKWLKSSIDVYEKSDGALDLTIGPVARLWDIGGEHPRVPAKEEIKQTSLLVDGSKLKVRGDQVNFAIKDGQLDLGAVGKGIACDEIADMLEKETISVNGTFSVGGSVLLYGQKPDKSEWKIGIQDPRKDDGENMGFLSISQEKGDKTYISTSGDYEKYIEKDGVRYHHIMDPRTGYPADSGLISVTIISKSGFLSDALSTACFVEGLFEGTKLAKAYGAEAVFIDKDKNVYATPGAKKYLTILEKEYQLSDETE